MQHQGQQSNKILIVGANGQLGQCIRTLSESMPGLSFIFTDVQELDITNPTAVQQYCALHHPAFVVNCAAYTAVDKAESEPDKATLINATAVRHLAQAAQAVGAYLIHVSTDYVFDGTACTPYTEAQEVNPQSVYGRTKQQGEHEALAYPQAMVIRTSWLYSAYGANFVKTMMRLGAERTQLNVVFDQVGTPTHAADLARAILHVVEQVHQQPARFVRGIYHYSNEGVCSWYDFAVEIMQLAGHHGCQVLPVESSEYPTPVRRPPYSVLNKGKIKRTYGIQIPHWRKSLQDCLKQM